MINIVIKIDSTYASCHRSMFSYWKKIQVFYTVQFINSYIFLMLCTF